MNWTPYTDQQKREGAEATLERLRKLAREDLEKLEAILRRHTNSSSVDWSGVSREIYDATGGFSDLDADAIWALMPFIVRAHDIRGGATK